MTTETFPDVDSLLEQIFASKIADHDMRKVLEHVADELIKANAEIYRLKMVETGLMRALDQAEMSREAIEISLGNLIKVIDKKAINAIQRKSGGLLLAVLFGCRAGHEAMAAKLPARLRQSRRGAPTKWDADILSAVENMRAPNESDMSVSKRYLINAGIQKRQAMKQAEALADALSRSRINKRHRIITR